MLMPVISVQILEYSFEWIYPHAYCTMSNICKQNQEKKHIWCINLRIHLYPWCQKPKNEVEYQFYLTVAWWHHVESYTCVNIDLCSGVSCVRVELVLSELFNVKVSRIWNTKLSIHENAFEMKLCEYGIPVLSNYICLWCQCWRTQ